MKFSEVVSESQIQESSGYSFQGSWTPDLIVSKIWLARELSQALDGKTVPVAYVLGSWFSNLSIILRRMGINIDQIINVDQQTAWLKQGSAVAKAMGYDNIVHMKANANRIDYRRLESPGVVINSSTNDIADHGWFDHIPSGTLVVLQGRDNVADGAEHEFHSPDELLKLYPLEKVLYKGSLELEDPETDYTRHMVIGIKGSETLRELNFLGSPCTKDCSGHRAGYYWSARKGNKTANSWSQSFNNGAALRASGK